MYGYALDLIRATALPLAVIYAARAMAPRYRLQRARRHAATAPVPWIDSDSRHARAERARQTARATAVADATALQLDRVRRYGENGGAR